MKLPLLALVAVAVAVPFALAACGDSKPAGVVTPPAASASQRPATPALASASAAADGGGMPKLEELTENDFIENDRNRDPFRSFLKLDGPRQSDRASNQRDVLLAQYGVDELKLVAIILAADGPMAMLVDPSKRGWVVRKGNYIGRSEVVHTGGQNGADYQVNWRIDRVRDGDVVLIREDAANPSAPPATRVIALHSEKETTNPLN